MSLLAHHHFGEQLSTFTISNINEIIDTGGLAYPSIIETSTVVDFPFDYALFLSTDHITPPDPGGIWLHVCNGDPRVAGNWKSYDQALADGDFDYLPAKPAANPIYQDTVAGNQTETPWAQVIGGEIYLTYHNNAVVPGDRAGGQRTLLAKSTDGVNYNRVGVILDYDPEALPGLGHTGYFIWGANPFSGVANNYVGYSLAGGGGVSPLDAMWGSDDGENWTMLTMIPEVGGRPELNLETGEKLLPLFRWNPGLIELVGGRYVTIGVNRERGASGGNPVAKRLVEHVLDDKGTYITSEVYNNHDISGGGFQRTHYLGNDVFLFQSGGKIYTADLAIRSISSAPKLLYPLENQGTVFDIDFRTQQFLPGWLVNYGPALGRTYNAVDGMIVPSDPDLNGVQFDQAIDLSWDFFEITVFGLDRHGENSGLNLSICPLDLEDPRIRFITFPTQTIDPGHLLLQSTGIAPALSANYHTGVGNDENKKAKHTFGLRWYIKESRAALIDEHGNEFWGNEVVADMSTEPVYATLTLRNGDWSVQRIRVRYGLYTD